MSQRYFKMAQMREHLLGLEEEVGLGALTQNEKDVFYAYYTEIYMAGGTAKSVGIKTVSYTHLTLPTKRIV